MKWYLIMATEWDVRMFLFVRVVDNTPANRQAFGAIFADNSSGETQENEEKLFDSVIRMSTSGELPVQVFGINTALKRNDMREDMRNFVSGLSLSRYYVIANTELSQYYDGELLRDNRTPTLVPWPGVFTLQDALDNLYDDRGLQVIPDEEV